MPRDDHEGMQMQLPYSQRPEWQDVMPVPQDDGPEPLAVISYPPGFVEVHDYFRAIQQKGELTLRALWLTADVIEQNSANYTAWYYRRRCLREVKADLYAEHRFTDKWARDCPKNYQVWYHRRWLIMEMAQELRSGGEADAEKEVTELAERELEYHMDCMQVNDDYKNYNGWSHRQFILQKFGLWSKELPFVEELLRDDIRNNSAWNHRHNIVRNECWPVTEAVRQREVDFALNSIRKCASNECSWNYLGAYLGEGEGKVPWTSVPALEALCQEVLALAAGPEHFCRFAVEALANIHEARVEVQDAIQKYETLKAIDKIRVKYWDWRIALLLKKTGG